MPRLGDSQKLWTSSFLASLPRPELPLPSWETPGSLSPPLPWEGRSWLWWSRRLCFCGSCQFRWHSHPFPIAAALLPGTLGPGTIHMPREPQFTSGEDVEGALRNSGLPTLQPENPVKASILARSYLGPEAHTSPQLTMAALSTACPWPPKHQEYPNSGTLSSSSLGCRSPHSSPHAFLLPSPLFPQPQGPSLNPHKGCHPRGAPNRSPPDTGRVSANTEYCEWALNTGQGPRGMGLSQVFGGSRSLRPWRFSELPCGIDVPPSCPRKGGLWPPTAVFAHWLTARQAPGAPLALFLFHSS